MRLLSICLAMILTLPAPAQEFEEESKRLEETLSAMARVDQKHPDFLHASLDYAQLLARSSDENCLERLPKAESLLETVRNSQVAELVLGTSAARIPFTAYLIEMARFRCEIDPARRRTALLEAQKEARAAVDGYRAGFHYDAMAVMQYNVAQATRELGDESLAIAELEKAIEMDRTYGLRDDAADNFKNLREWRGQTTSDEEVAEFRKSLAAKTTTLAFAWKPFTATAHTTFDLGAFEGNYAKHTILKLPIARTLRPDGAGFLLENSPGKPEVELDSGESVEAKIEQAMLTMLARILGSQAPAKLDKTGNFLGVGATDVVAKTLERAIDGSLAGVLPETDARFVNVKASIGGLLKPMATVEGLNAEARESYILDTAIWVGAKLEHGSWMEAKHVLSMNGTPNGFVEQRVRVVLARWLPCAKGRPPTSCVELLFDARPLPEAIDAIAKSMSEEGQGRLDYAGETRRRLVVDPATLMLYESQTLRMGYLALTKDKQRVVKIGTDRTHVTYQYAK
jgi:hypothetical protein